jgi:uncharacterized repeat protein (TIGR03803 family)
VQQRHDSYALPAGKAQPQRWISEICLQAASAAFVLAIVLVHLVFSTQAQAQTYSVLYSFKGGSDGANPAGALSVDAAGNLYGTTVVGGSAQQGCTGNSGSGCGTVFKLTHQSNGKWTETVLYRFQGSNNNGSDGAGPYGAMVLDSDGSLLGATVWGGAYSACPGGCGAVFQVTPKSGHGWTETVVHKFNGPDGDAPEGGLFSDKAGNIYGTTVTGGANGGGVGGVVFKLRSRSWRESTLYSFCSQSECSDGGFSFAGVFSAADGSLYGTTSGGGKSSFACPIGVGCGTVFKLAPDSKGWKETVLHEFDGGDGAQPWAGLTSDANGNLYGTTTIDGAFGFGTVFNLTHTSTGRWKYTVLHSFRSGSYPGSFSTKLVNVAGRFYGTFIGGEGMACGGGGCGVIYELTRGAHGRWQYRELYKFSGGKDGGDPFADMISDKKGNLYGTAAVGGEAGYGVVFEITL